MMVPPTDDRQTEATNQFVAELAQLAEKCQGVVNQYAAYLAENDGFSILHPMVVGQAFQDMAAKALENPEALIKEQLAYWNELGQLWQNTAKRFLGEGPVAPVVDPAPATVVSRTTNGRRRWPSTWSNNSIC